MEKIAGSMVGKTPLVIFFSHPPPEGLDGIFLRSGVFFRAFFVSENLCFDFRETIQVCMAKDRILPRSKKHHDIMAVKTREGWGGCQSAPRIASEFFSSLAGF